MEYSSSRKLYWHSPNWVHISLPKNKNIIYCMPFSVPKERQSSEGICKIMRNVMSTFDSVTKVLQ